MKYPPDCVPYENLKRDERLAEQELKELDEEAYWEHQERISDR